MSRNESIEHLEYEPSGALRTPKWVLAVLAVLALAVAGANRADDHQEKGSQPPTSGLSQRLPLTASPSDPARRIASWGSNANAAEHHVQLAQPEAYFRSANAAEHRMELEAAARQCRRR